jgi:hypothetical protein
MDKIIITRKIILKAQRREADVGIGNYQRWAPTRKSESADRERKKREFALFPPSHTGNPVPEPKASRQGGNHSPNF